MGLVFDHRLREFEEVQIDDIIYTVGRQNYKPDHCYDLGSLANKPDFLSIKRGKLVLSLDKVNYALNKASLLGTGESIEDVTEYLDKVYNGWLHISIPEYAATFVIDNKRVHTVDASMIDTELDWNRFCIMSSESINAEKIGTLIMPHICKRIENGLVKSTAKLVEHLVVQKEVIKYEFECRRIAHYGNTIYVMIPGMCSTWMFYLKKITIKDGDKTVGSFKVVPLKYRGRA